MSPRREESTKRRGGGESPPTEVGRIESADRRMHATTCYRDWSSVVTTRVHFRGTWARVAVPSVVVAACSSRQLVSEPLGSASVQQRIRSNVDVSSGRAYTRGHTGRRTRPRSAGSGSQAAHRNERCNFQYTMFRGGAVSQAIALESDDTPHELDAVAAIHLMEQIPDLQRAGQTDAISLEATKKAAGSSGCESKRRRRRLGRRRAAPNRGRSHTPSGTLGG